MKKILGLMALALLTGCSKDGPVQMGVTPHPSQNTAPCRATPVHNTRYAHPPVCPGGDTRCDANRPFITLTDDKVIFTGETNGQEGATETVILCKPGLVTCVTAGGTGMLPDGTMVEYSAEQIEIKGAITNGYEQAEVRIEYSCHG